MVVKKDAKAIGYFITAPMPTIAGMPAHELYSVQKLLNPCTNRGQTGR